MLYWNSMSWEADCMLIVSYAYIPWHGKAPPIDPFTAEDIEITFDDRLVEWAAIWNEWTPEESLMQLAGHLRGQALYERKLLFAKREDKLSGCYKSTKRKMRFWISNFNSIRFSPFFTDNEWVSVRLHGTAWKSISDWVWSKTSV